MQSSEHVQRCTTQELNTYKKFGDSLLARSAKLSDYVSQLENYSAEETVDGATKRRIKKCRAHSETTLGMSLLI